MGRDAWALRIVINGASANDPTSCANSRSWIQALAQRPAGARWFIVARETDATRGLRFLSFTLDICHFVRCIKYVVPSRPFFAVCRPAISNGIAVTRCYLPFWKLENELFSLLFLFAVSLTAFAVGVVCGWSINLVFLHRFSFCIFLHISWYKMNTIEMNEMDIWWSIGRVDSNWVGRAWSIFRRT